MDLHAPLHLYDTPYSKGTEDSEIVCPPDRTYCCVRRGATLARPAVWAPGSPLPAGLPYGYSRGPCQRTLRAPGRPRFRHPRYVWPAYEIRHTAKLG